MRRFRERNSSCRCARRLIFPNCPRYIHRLAEVERSEYVPHAGLEAPVPAWKRFEMFADVLPAGDPARSPTTKPNIVRDRGPVG